MARSVDSHIGSVGDTMPSDGMASNDASSTSVR